MAANDELPRGWDLSATASGGTLGITLPAVPGISHVVTSLLLGGYSGGQNGVSGDQITISDTITAFVPVEFIVEPIAAGSYAAVGPYSWTGSFVGATGKAVTVSVPISGLSGSNGWNLEIQGYDI